MIKKTGSEIITEILKMHDIETVAGMPGGSILPLYDELARSGIRHILIRQEQAAGFIAQGMARTTGKPAVCLATSGPGAMNLLTSIADARCDSIPIIAITGQVNLSLIGTDAFQEADTFGLSFPITKHSIMVKSAAELLTALPEAFEIATSGRPGPVLIDVPRNVQLETAEFESWPQIHLTNEKSRFHDDKETCATVLNKMAKELLNCKKPVLYIGGGCNSPEAADGIAKFLSVYKMSVVSSLMGIGSVSSLDKNYLGMVGMHGSIAANKAMYESDLVLAAGVRFDDRAVGVTNKFCPNAKILHIDIDAAEVNKILSANISLVADVESSFPFLAELINECENSSFVDKNNASERLEWVKTMADLRRESLSFECGSYKESTLPNPREFIANIPHFAESAGVEKSSLIFTTDVGQHQMWAAQYLPVEKPRTFLTSGSLGTMGFGLPTAIGAALANPENRIVCISGDGSIMMNIQELATLSECKLSVTVIVLENGTLGMVYQQQKYVFNKNYSASVFSEKPDLLAIAKGFGLKVFDANEDKDWAKKAFEKNSGPCFVRLRINPEENVLPYVKAGSANVDSIKE